MKKILFVLLMVGTHLGAAQTPSDNYVRVYRAQQASTGDLSTVNDKNQVSIVTIYYDGLGREIQTVAKQQSPLGFDVVSVSAYDGFGRKTTSYLPYVSVEANGSLKANPFNDQLNFYTTNFGATDGAFAFAFSKLETSELSRLIEQTSPGDAWKLGSGHTVKTKYGTNTASEVLRLQVSDAGTLYVTPGAASYYFLSELSVKTVRDEQQNDVIEYTDKEGRVVCKKVAAGGGQYAETYYVYDNNGNLVVVVQPEGVRDIRALLPSPQ